MRNLPSPARCGRAVLRAAPACAAAALAAAAGLPAAHASRTADRAALRASAVAAPAWRDAVPAGFQPASAAFVSADRGFVLGAVGCPLGQSCRARLAVTADGGARWRLARAPDVRLPGSTAERKSDVTEVAFAGPRTGWLYGPGMWVTRDGGSRWHRVAIGGRVEAVVVSAAGVAYAAVVPPRSPVTVLYASPVRRDAWKPVRGVTAAPAFSLAASGRSAWLGSGDSLWASADGLHWHHYRFGCAGRFYELTDIAAASMSRVDFLCTSGAQFNTGEEGMEVMTSLNGGRTERLAGRKAPVTGDGGAIAMPPGRPRIITFAVSAGIPSWIGRSADGGRTWTRVAFFTRGAGWDSLQYASRAEGWIVLGRPGLRGTALLRTTDAGRTWHRVGMLPPRAPAASPGNRTATCAVSRS